MRSLTAIGAEPRVPRWALDAYRAGFRDGRKPVEPQVFREGDPAPGPETTAVMDRDLDVARRYGDRWGYSTYDDGADREWGQLLTYGPLLDCSALPEYHAAVQADHRRRAAARSAGGAR